MTDPRLKRHYLTACGLVAVSAVLGILTPVVDGSASPADPRILVVLALLVLFFLTAAVATRRRLTDLVDAAGDEAGERRLRKMAVIWYGLSAVLGFAMLRGPAGIVLRGGSLREARPLQLVFAAGGLAIILLALSGAASFLLRKGASRGGTRPEN
jgi:nitrogen fixation/metabolism regulation signal transduction histidine kinase